MFRFRLDIAGEIQMDRGIARFADGVADYRPIWPVIEDDFYAMEKEQFETEGGAGGEHWVEPSPEYEGWKEAHYPGRPILERKGDLKRSLTNANDPNTVRIEQRKTLTLGTRIPYAIYHQTGSRDYVQGKSLGQGRDKAGRFSGERFERGSGGLPQRKEIQFTEGVKRTTMHHVQTYLVQIASQSGFRQGMGPLDVGRLAGYAARKPAGSYTPWGLAGL
jgi:phage gpG-like protein